jgi:hypothetical protein
MVKRRGGTTKLVSWRSERYFGDRRFHSYAGGANSSSITSSGYVPLPSALLMRAVAAWRPVFTAAYLPWGREPLLRRTTSCP